MNPRLQLLQPYPFEQLKQLFAGLTPPAHLRPISLGIGEPKHATPPLIQNALVHAAQSGALAAYPATAGESTLRQAIAAWVQQRYGLALDAATQVLPVNGSREALFALAQTVVNADSHLENTTKIIAACAGLTDQNGKKAFEKPLVIYPNPFYQIYEGAALLAGADTLAAPADPARNFAVDWAAVPAAQWARCQLLYACSPGNPTGAVMPLEEWAKLFALSDEHGFCIASDECYSEIYFGAEPPLGGLEAAAKLGRTDFKNLIAFTSLSKRSNVPGLRSGFVAGDAALIKAFLLYRTYHGSAMSPAVQAASRAAWGDEAHVVANRQLYRDKFAAVTPILQTVMDVALPDAGFYLWAAVPQHCFGGADTDFARELYAQYNVTVLPGSYLAREQTLGSSTTNPGAGRVRMALVAATEECVEAAQRIAQFIQSQRA